MKLKVGDRVKYTSGIYGDEKQNPLWDGKYGKVIGTLVSIVQAECSLFVQWDNKTRNNYVPSDLELVEEQRQLNLFERGNE